MFAYWGGYISASPLDLVPMTPVNEHNSILLLMYKALAGLIWMGVFLLFAYGSQVLSIRYRFNSWKEFRDHQNKLFKESFIDRGTVQDIDILNNEVVVKTESAVYKCEGSISKVEKGSPVQEQNGDLILIDKNSKVRLKIA